MSHMEYAQAYAIRALEFRMAGETAWAEYFKIKAQEHSAWHQREIGR